MLSDDESTRRCRRQSPVVGSVLEPATVRVRGVSAGPWLLLVLTVVWSAVGCVSAAGGMCDGGCQNGGKLLMPNNVFGYCRCRCPPDFKGPKCQFVDKRGAGPATAVDGLSGEDWNAAQQPAVAQSHLPSSRLEDADHSAMEDEHTVAASDAVLDRLLLELIGQLDDARRAKLFEYLATSSDSD